MKTKVDIFEMICNSFLDCDYCCPKYAKCCEPYSVRCLHTTMIVTSLECLERGAY